MAGKQQTTRSRLDVEQAVPAVAKCIAILRYLDGHGSEGVNLSEIAADLAITKSHCFNILRTLNAEGWVVYDADRRRYSLGASLLRDLARLTGRRDFSAQVHDELVRLSAETGLPSILCRVDESDDFVAVDKVERAGELLAAVHVGFRYPWDAPTQLRARLAFSSPDAIKAALRRKPRAYTPHTLTRRHDLLAEIRMTSQRGYAVGRSEYTPGIMTLAAPVRDGLGRVAFVLQTPGIQSVLEPREKKVAAVLLGAVGRIEAVL
ncbi:IclR family transcriptional regulator C-terminal domain-containing protein [Bradyrhizobium sp. NP1]|uniref:IclR family transcriptional regulator n=1 Tax=Bradyrhizobium sp. NP1 TaxID=3049772 RepID=UPI0025A4E3E6|nr:IclR family transcriptional regulator C-terminal domain-containing protein [Bradyrhizobium sp. NP1]WJR77259.1 IclR family transcriptional regulator C-terminal domain-containing protein [Bradyrhizobium sp. NP1]